MNKKIEGRFLAALLFFLPSGDLLAFVIFDGIINLVYVYHKLRSRNERRNFNVNARYVWRLC
jgi:hypothetical protein